MSFKSSVSRKIMRVQIKNEYDGQTDVQQLKVASIILYKMVRDANIGCHTDAAYSRNVSAKKQVKVPRPNAERQTIQTITQFDLQFSDRTKNYLSYPG